MYLTRFIHIYKISYTLGPLRWLKVTSGPVLLLKKQRQASDDLKLAMQGKKNLVGLKAAIEVAKGAGMDVTDAKTLYDQEGRDNYYFYSQNGPFLDFPWESSKIT